MTLQEIFDKSSTHLLTQNARSLAPSSDFFCAYRGRNELKCAVGVLISDEAYSHDLEGRGCDALEVEQALEASGVPTTREARDLMDALQYIHDYVEPQDWHEQLRDLAARLGLQFSAGG